MRRQPIKHDYNKVAMAGFIIAFAVAILAFYYIFQATIGLSTAGRMQMACVQLKIPMSECTGTNIKLGMAEYSPCGCLKLTKEKDGEWRKSTVYSQILGKRIGAKDYSEDSRFDLCSSDNVECMCRVNCEQIQPQKPGSTKTIFLCAGEACGATRSMLVEDIPESEIIAEYGQI